MSLLSNILKIVRRDGKLTRTDRKSWENYYNSLPGTPVTIIATAAGDGTGLIPASANFVSVTSDTATKQISLPAAVDGKKITLSVPAVGCELISVVAADKVNNVIVGATNEAALGAATIHELCYTAGNWVMITKSNTGVVSAVVPDIL